MRIALHDPAAWPRWFTRTLLAVIPLALYGGSLGFGLLGFDDQGYYYNPALAGGSWPGLLALWTTTAMSDYAPVSQLTVWADLALGGQQWWFAHLQQILWFAAGAWAIHALVLRVSGHAGLAVVVALLYVLHPLGGESVLWLAERKNLVAFALSIWCVERYVAAVRDGAGWPAVTLSWSLGILALLAKPHAVCLPLLLAAYEVALGAGPWLGRIVRVAVPALLVAAYIAIELHYLRNDLQREPLAGSRLGAVLVDGQILWRYLAEVVLPRQLTIYYAAPESVDATMVMLAWATLLALVGASLWPARTRAVVAFSWLFAAAALAPALNLVPQLAPCADHYLLWALPALLLLGVVLVDDLLLRRPPGGDRRLPWLLGGGLALYLGLLALARLPEFASRQALFRAAVRHQPDCGINWAHYITYELEQGVDPTRIEPAAVRALQCVDSGRILSEDRAMVIVLAALALHHQGEPAAATALLEREVARLPADGGVIADIVRAQFAMRSGDPARAVVLLQRFYPPPLREAAAALRARCRSGAELPDAQPPAIGVTATRAIMADRVDIEHWLDNQERQLQSLAYACEMSGDLEQAFDVAALALNMVPSNAQARQLLIAIDRQLHLDAAAERLAGGATGVPPAPSR